MTTEPAEAPLNPLRALVLLAVVIAFFVLGETGIGLLAAAVWLLLVIFYGRRRA